MNNNPYSKIKQNTIFTASPHELTLMLYDGAIKFGNQAILAIENGDVEKAHNYIIRVQDIIEEFRVTLDMEYEVAQSMDLVYDYIYRKLIEANISKNIESLNEAVDMIRELRNTWKEAMQLVKTLSQTTQAL